MVQIQNKGHKAINKNLIRKLLKMRMKKFNLKRFKLEIS